MDGKLVMSKEQLENFFATDEIPEVAKEKEIVETKTETPKAAEKEITFDDLYKENVADEVIENVPKKENKTVSDVGDEKQLLLNQIEFYKTKNYLPDDFELPEGEELTQDLFGQILEYSTQFIKGQVYEEVVESTGKQGKSIIEYINNGGNPEKIVDLFKTQQDNQLINTETIDGQKRIVTEFYKKLDWSDDDIEEFIDNKINSDKLQKEAERIKLKVDVDSEKKINKELETQQERRVKEIQISNQRKNKFAETLKDDYKQQDIRNIVSFVYDESDEHHLTDFELRIIDIQKKPNELKDLVEYLINPDKFIKSKSIALQNKKTESTWSKITNNTTKSTGSSRPVEKKATWIF